MLVIGGRAIRGEALELAGRIAGKTGATLATQFFSSRIERGAGRVQTYRIPYFVEPALKALAGFKHFVTVETREPVAFFAYPGKPSVRRRMIWNSRANFGSEVIGSSGLSYAA